MEKKKIMNKKIVLVYESPTGNTEKIAKEMAKWLDCDLKKAGETSPEEISKYEIAGFGSGIYFSNMHRKILSLINLLEMKKGKKAFLFATSGKGSIPVLHDFFRKPEKILRKKGYEVMGLFECRGIDKVGPLKLFGGINKKSPCKKDFEAAKCFAEKIKKLCS